MSDIPFARVVLRKALHSDDLKFVHQSIKRALGMLDREQPEFRCKPSIPPLTQKQVATAKQLRRAEMSVNDIARKLGTNNGRVSEAINGKRKGI